MKVCLVAGDKTASAVITVEKIIDDIMEIPSIDELSDTLLEQPGLMVDVDHIMVLQYAFNKDEKQKIVEIQESMMFAESSGVKAKLDIIIKDAGLYESLKGQPIDEVISYSNTYIYVCEVITNTFIQGVISGSIKDVISKSESIFSVDRTEYSEKHPDDDRVKKDVFDKIKKEEPENVVEEPKQKRLFSMDALKQKLMPDEEKPRPEKREHVKRETVRREVEHRNKMLVKPVIVVTGDRCSGVTSVAINMAETLARYKKMNVLLVDMDFTRRSISLMYKDFNRYCIERSAGRLGTMAALNNVDTIPHGIITVDTGISLLAMSNEPDTFEKNFAGKALGEIMTGEHARRMIDFIRIMDVFDFVIIDMPFEVLKSMLSVSSSVDKFILCCENTVQSVHNTFSASLGAMADMDELSYRAVIDKSLVLATKFRGDNKYGGKAIDSKFMVDILKRSFMCYPSEIGALSFDNVYNRQMEVQKPACKISDQIDSDFRNIVEILV